MQLFRVSGLGGQASSLGVIQDGLAAKPFKFRKSKRPGVGVPKDYPRITLGQLRISVESQGRGRGAGEYLRITLGLL